MRWSRSLPILLGVGITVTLITVQAQQPPERLRAVLTDRDAFLLAPPEIVAPPNVLQAAWSSDARSVLVVRQQEPPALALPAGRALPQEISLVLWSRGTGRSQEVWKKAGSTAMVERIAWLPRTSVALAIVGSGAPGEAAPLPRRALLRVEGVRVPPRPIADLDPGEELLTSPFQPWGVLYRRDRPSLRRVAANGSVGQAVPLPGPFDLAWSPEGDLLLREWGPSPASGQPQASKWYAMEFPSGAIHALAAPPGIHDEAVGLTGASPLRLRATALTLKEESTTASVRPLWLESATKSEQPRALVCADSDWAQLAPDGSAVLFRSQGAAWAMQVLRVPKMAFLEARRAALRQVAQSNAKQIGLALMMYVQDYDEILPPADTVNDRLSPYLKNRELFNTPGTDTPGFVYLYHVAPTTSIREPAKTKLGYLPGPGGRAVIYADGHVEWEDD